MPIAPGAGRVRVRVRVRRSRVRVRVRVRRGNGNVVLRVGVMVRAMVRVGVRSFSTVDQRRTHWCGIGMSYKRGCWRWSGGWKDEVRH